MILMYKFRHGSNPDHLIHYGKALLTITPLEWLVATHIIFDRNTEEKKHLKLSDFLNQFQGIITILNALQDLASMHCNPGLYKATFR